MTKIEGHWENADSLQDISRIIREYYNYDLADVMDELIAENIMYDYEKERLEELEMTLQQIRDLVF